MGLDYHQKVLLLKAFTLFVVNALPLEGRMEWKRQGLRQPEHKYTEIAADDALFIAACHELADLIKWYL